MADGVKPRVKVPKSASAGEAVINRFVVDFNGQNVLDVTLEPAISTNPYFEFEATVPESGDFTFTWYDDDGSVYTETQSVTVG